MGLKTYNLKEVQVVYGGAIISGYGQAGGVQIEFNEDLWEPIVGADGEETRARKNSDGGEITLTLMNTSNSNDVLQGLMETDLLTGAGVHPMLVKDTNGRSVYSSREAYILRKPDTEFNMATGEREWKIRCADLSDFAGGN